MLRSILHHWKRWLLVVGIVTPLAAISLYAIYKSRRHQNTLGLLRNAAEARAAEDWESADMYYRQYLARTPMDAGALAEHVAVLLERMKESPRTTVGDAVRTLRRLVQLRPADGDAAEKLLALYLGLHEFPSAEALAGRWIEKSPRSVTFALGHASALAGQGRDEQAVAALERAIGSMPGAGSLYAPLVALLAERLDRMDEATVWLERGLKVASDAPDVQMAAFGLHQRAGDLPQAERDLQRALELAPQDVAILVSASMFHTLGGDLDRAKEYLDRAVQHAPGHRTLLFVRAAWAVKRASEQDIKDAADELVRWARPNDGVMIAQAGQLYFGAGHLKEGRECIGRLESLPTSTKAAQTRLRILRGAAALLEDRPHVAVSQLVPVVSGDRGGLWATALLARAYVATGAYREASALYRRLLRSAPDANSARLALADVELKRGRSDAAVELVDRVSTAGGRERHLADILGVLDAIAESQRNDDTEASAMALGELERLADPPATDTEATRLLATACAMAGRTERAISILRRGMNQPGAGPALGVALAKLLLSERSFDDARRIAERLLERFPDRVHGYEMKVRIAASMGRFAEAEEYVDGCAVAQEDRGKLWVALADAYMAADQKEACLESLRRATKLAPQDMAVRGNLIAMTPRLDEALSASDEMRVIEGDDGVFWKFERASALMRLDRTPAASEEAVALLRQCLILRPRWLAARLKLAGAQQMNGALADAAESLRSAFRLEPRLATGPAAVQLVGILYRLHRDTEGDALLDRLADARPDSEEVLRLQIDRDVRRGDPESALRAADSLLARRPDDPVLAAQVAAMHLQSGDAARAERIARKALDAAPDSFSVLATVAHAMVAQDRADEAVALLTEASKTERGALVDTVLADVLEGLGKRRRAEDAVARALAGRPNDADVLTRCAAFWGRRGERSKQIELTRRAIEARGENAEASIDLAELLLSEPTPEARTQVSAIVQTLLALDGDDPRALVVQAKLHCLARPPQWEEAEAALMRALSVAPKMLAAHRMLVYARMERQQLTTARDAVDVALTYAPNDYELLLASAEIAFKLGRLEASVAPLVRALGIRPRSGRALRALVDACVQADHVEPAMNHIERNIPADERTPAETLLLARLYEAQREFERTDALLRHAVDVSDGSSETVQAYIGYAARRRDYGRVLELAARQRVHHPDDVDAVLSAAEILGGHAVDPSTRETAMNWLAAIETDHPDRAADAKYKAARCHYERGDPTEAAAIMCDVLEAQPLHASAANDLAWLYSEELDRPADALAVLERYTAAGGVETPSLLDTYGLVLARNGRPVEAERKLEACIKLTGYSATASAAHWHLGVVLADRGRARSGMSHMRQAVRLHDRLGGLTERERAEAARRIRAETMTPVHP